MAITSTPLSLLLPLFLTTLLCPTRAATPCTNELVLFSACLPYASAPPNNATASPSDDCCDKFTGTLASGNGSCWCLLLVEPPVLGFPLNSTRIVSLPSVCPLPPQLRNFTLFRNFSLLSFCSDAPPPLPSAAPESQMHLNFAGLSPDYAPPESPSPRLDLVSSNLADSPPESPSPRLNLRPLSVGREAPPSPELHLGSSQVSSASRIRNSWTWFLPPSFPNLHLRFHSVAMGADRTTITSFCMGYCKSSSPTEI